MTTSIQTERVVAFAASLRQRESAGSVEQSVSAAKLELLRACEAPANEHKPLDLLDGKGTFAAAQVTQGKAPPLPGVEGNQSMCRPPPYERVPHDEGARKAIEDFKSLRPVGQITDGQMKDLIRDATIDFDGQSAGLEYKELAGFVRENWDRLSPGAKANWEKYDGAVSRAMAQGATGIAFPEYLKTLDSMTSKERSLPPFFHKPVNPFHGGPALPREPMPGFGPQGGPAKVNPADIKPVGDNGKATGPGLDGFTGRAPFVPGPFDPVIDPSQLTVGDASAHKAIDECKKRVGKGPILDSDIAQLVRDGTKDLDGQAAGLEYKDLAKYVQENWSRLTPGAQENWKKYEGAVSRAMARHQTGIPQSEWRKAVDSMTTREHRPLICRPPIAMSAVANGG